MKMTYQTTMKACFAGYIVQAIVNNFIPLLFITFQDAYQISLTKITLLISINFGAQLLVDMAATLFVDRIGYRISTVAAHAFAAGGFILLPVLPEIIDPFTGILIAVIVYAIGSGLIEVLISPIMESCPTENKEKAMSLLHSFYCWGHVGVVLLSTIFFTCFGIENWKILAFLWAAIPVVNGLVFAKTPIDPLISDDGQGMTMGDLFNNKIFWMLLILMVCAGASEQSVSQWASAFAQKGLGISKMMGDLVGPMGFAVMMGCSRVLFGKYGHRINLDSFMKLSGLLCVGTYLIITLVPSSLANITACALCGFSVGIMWPGTFSKATVLLKNGGTAMFAIMALAGDLGCSIGPAFVGILSNLVGDLRLGILGATIFPGLFFIILLKNL